MSLPRTEYDQLIRQSEKAQESLDHMRQHYEERIAKLESDLHEKYEGVVLIREVESRDWGRYHPSPDTTYTLLRGTIAFTALFDKMSNKQEIDALKKEIKALNKAISAAKKELRPRSIEIRGKNTRMKSALNELEKV